MIGLPPGCVAQRPNFSTHSPGMSAKTTHQAISKQFCVLSTLLLQPLWLLKADQLIEKQALIAMAGKFLRLSEQLRKPIV